MTIPVNQNYVPNPSFVDGVNKWVGLDATIEAVATGGYSGNECLRVVKTIQEYSGVQGSEYISVNARGESNTYTASAYVQIPSDYDNGTLMLSIVWYTLGKVYISTSDSATSSVTAGAAWTRLTVTASAPDNARYAVVRVVQTVGGDAGEVFLVDAVKLEIGSSATAFQESVDQGQENAIVNRGLTKVPFPHLTGMQLNADIELNNMVFNTIDSDGFVYVITDITGVFNQPEPEFAEMSRGLYKDGDFDTRGRYKARYINITGSVLIPGPEYISEARDKIVRATDLVRNGAWLKLKPANEPVKAMFVRLNGATTTTVVNPRGRIDFSIGLKAADPVLYEWNEDRTDGYTVANVYASNYSGTEVGSVEVGNNGNYPVGAIYEIRGPITGDSATLFNYSNSDLATVIGSIRGERYRAISKKKLDETVATLNFTHPHDFIVGDEIYVSMPNSIAVTEVDRGSGNSYATITSAQAAYYKNGESVVLSNVDSSLDGVSLTISNVASTTFTVPSTNTSALSNTSLSSATANNITNDLFNGTQYIVATPNNKSVQYYIQTRASVPLTDASSSSIAAMRNVVYKDADYLEIDTVNNEVALNGSVPGSRGLLDALIDWVKLEAGNNVIELDDSGQLPLFVEKRSVDANGIATLFVSVPHGLKVGDNIHVEYAGTDYDTTGRARVSSFTRDGYTATITANGHGFSNNDTVILSNVSRGVDGQYEIDNATTNTFTVTTSSSDVVYATAVDGVAKLIIPVRYYAKSNNTVTLTVDNAAAFAISDTIYVTNVHEDLDGQATITSVDTGTNVVRYLTTGRKPSGKILTTAAPDNAQIARRYPLTSVTEYSLTYDTGRTPAAAETNVLTGMLASTENSGYYSVVGYQRTLNVATITTQTKHGFAAGDFVTVAGNVATSFNVGYGNPKQIVSYTVAGSSVTAIVNAHGLVANDTATIYGIDTGISGIDVNGTYRVTSVPNVNAIVYTLDTALKLSYTVTGSELVSDVAILTLSETPEFTTVDENGDPTLITISNVGSPYDGTFEVTGVETRNNTITFDVTGGGTVAFASESGTLDLTYDKTPERGFAFQKNEVMVYTVNASQTDHTNTTTGTYAHFLTQNSHGLSVGDTVDLIGISSIINGTREVEYVASTTRFTVKIENNSIIQRKTATGVRSASKYGVTLTASNHGLNPGDWIYLDSSSAGLTADGKYKVTSRPNASAFTITGTNNSATAYTATTTHYWYPLREDAYAVQAYPVLQSPAPTDYTFSYKNRNATANTTAATTPRSGEVVQTSDARMKVYYRSGWIG